MSRRGSTYGENMARWEHEQDERDWKNRLRKALVVQNPSAVKELVEEGLAEDFSFAGFNDPLVTAFQNKRSND